MFSMKGFQMKRIAFLGVLLVLGSLGLLRPAMAAEGPDPERFPSLRLAREALRAGGEMPAVLNAANEVAVGAFLDHSLSFPSITATIEAVMERWHARNRPLESVEQAEEADVEARRLAAEAARRLS